mgnify:CR=1 FL=1
MWRINKNGKEQVWYEAELIEKIKAICIKRPHQALDKILELIQENEK